MVSKKKSDEIGAPALIARCVTGTLLTTVCSHINREGKRETGTRAVTETNPNEFK